MSITLGLTMVEVALKFYKSFLMLQIAYSFPYERKIKGHFIYFKYMYGACKTDNFIFSNWLKHFIYNFI
jgi:hypothetical protein